MPPFPPLKLCLLFKKPAGPHKNGAKQMTDKAKEWASLVEAAEQRWKDEKQANRAIASTTVAKAQLDEIEKSKKRAIMDEARSKGEAGHGEEAGAPDDQLAPVVRRQLVRAAPATRERPCWPRPCCARGGRLGVALRGARLLVPVALSASRFGARCSHSRRSVRRDSRPIGASRDHDLPGQACGERCDSRGVVQSHRPPRLADFRPSASAPFVVELGSVGLVWGGGVVLAFGVGGMWRSGLDGCLAMGVGAGGRPPVQGVGGRAPESSG